MCRLQVYKAIRRGTTDVAVKTLSSNVISPELVYQMRKESVILQKVSRDTNVVRYFGACMSEPTMLVMEFMEVRLFMASSCPWITVSPAAGKPRSIRQVMVANGQ